MSDLKRLTDDDFKALLPETAHFLGKTAVMLKPLTLEEIAHCTAVLDTERLREAFGREGITPQNAPQRMSRVCGIVLEQAPELLEIVTGVHRDDLRRLPARALMGLADRVTEINLGSKGGLEKNWIAFAGLTATMVIGALRTPSTTCSSGDTDGATSGGIPSANAVSF